MNKITVLLLIATLFTACKPGKVPKDAKMIEQGSKMTKSSGANLELANFSIKVPENWVEETPSSNMRVKQYSLKGSPEYKIIVSTFGNFDNMEKANIERWKGQFSEQDSYEELELINKQVTGIKILGTFKKKPSPMAQQFTETQNYGMLAAILPSDNGPFFFKLTAPKAVINEQEASFVATLNTYSVK